MFMYILNNIKDFSPTLFPMKHINISLWDNFVCHFRSHFALFGVALFYVFQNDFKINFNFLRTPLGTVLNQAKRLQLWHVCNIVERYIYNIILRIYKEERDVKRDAKNYFIACHKCRRQMLWLPLPRPLPLPLLTMLQHQGKIYRSLGNLQHLHLLRLLLCRLLRALLWSFNSPQFSHLAKCEYYGVIASTHQLLPISRLAEKA